MEEIILDVLKDTIKTIPILFVVYLLLEYFEHKKSNKLEAKLLSNHKYGPFVCSLIGCLPQCGFSMAASKLYASKYITMGTLVAIFISTSDEAIPILLTNPNNYNVIISLLILKIIIAIISGYIIDYFIKTKLNETSNNLTHNCEHNILIASIIRTLKIFIFLLIINFIFSFTISKLSEETLSNIMLSNNIFQPVFACLLGLIPNCASSVFLAQFYMNGVLNFGSLLAGLCAQAGMGIIILIKENKNKKENTQILTSLILIGIISGMVVNLFI